MKLNNTAEVVEVHGGASRSSFSIAMNGKAFRVLSDTLYQNKIGSIVREISCNAYDAHIAANKKDIPFVIHLPDAFEPWFSVQDFGDGMSPDDISRVFTVYFHSTKDTSNDAIGAFGIGAKTPFSYTDQFTVVSVNNGERRVYSAFIDESDIPNIIEMSCSKDDGASGIEIKMSVKPEDYAQFAKETRTQLRFFDVKPTVVNAPDFKFFDHQTEFVFKNDRFCMVESEQYNLSAGLYAVHGIVGYPIDLSKCNKLSPLNEEFIRRFVNGSGYFFGGVQFPIGDIDVTSSRENLQYTERTISAIDNALTRVIADIADFISSEMANLKTVWDKAVFLSDNRVVKMTVPNIGVGLDSRISVDRNGRYFFSGLCKESLICKDTRIGIQKFVLSGSGVANSYYVDTIPCSPSTMIVVCDTKSKYRIRIKHLLRENKDATVYLIRYKATLPHESPEYVAATLVDLLGGYSGIRFISDIVVPKTQRATVGQYVTASHYVYNRMGRKLRSKWIKKTTDISTISTETAYIVSDKITTVILDNEDLFQRFNALTRDVPLICIRKRDVKAATQNSNLIEVVKWVEKELDVIRDNVEAHSDWKKFVIESFVLTIVPRPLLSDDVINHLTVAAPRSRATRMLRLCRRAIDRMSDNYTGTTLREMAATAGWKVYDALSEQRRLKLSDCVDAIFKRYPLLRLYGEPHNAMVRNAISPEHLAKYVSAF